MTGQDVLNVALNLMFEEGNEYDDCAVYFINLMIPELFDTENSIRANKGTEKLDNAPYITSLSDQIEYCDDLVRGAMPYGLASMIMFDDDTSKAGYFRSLYVNAVNGFTKYAPGTVVDVYE